MKKIGREVLFLTAGEGNPRNGEGAFIRLSDGRILYAFTRVTTGRTTAAQALQGFFPVTREKPGMGGRFF